MGKRGPKPTPTAELRLRGTARADRARDEPTPAPGVPRCPAWLDDHAKHAWRQLVPQLVTMRVLAAVDRNALARYCVLWGRWKAAELFLQKNGSVYTLKDSNGAVRCVQQFPQVGIAHRLAAALSRLEAEFGMTPSARARIEALPKGDQDEDDDPLQVFMSIAQ
jgi:P27 family predicted phage terminase small subunit